MKVQYDHKKEIQQEEVIKHSVIQLHKRITIPSKITYWPLPSDSEWLQYLTLTSRKLIQRFTNQRNSGVKKHHMNLTCICRILHSKHQKIHFLFSSSWNFLQNGPNLRIQSNSCQIQKNGKNIFHPVWPPWIKVDINNSKNGRKETSSRKLDNLLLKENWIETEI